MKYLRYKVEIAQPYSEDEHRVAAAHERILPNRDVDTETLILTILRAPRQGGLSTAEIVARAKVERDLQRSMAQIEAGGSSFLAFEDDRADTLRKVVQGHSWGGYAMAVAEFVEAIEAMPSEVPDGP